MKTAQRAVLLLNKRHMGIVSFVLLLIMIQSVYIKKYKCCLEMLIQNHLNTIDNFTEERIKEMFIKISAINKEKFQEIKKQEEAIEKTE